MLIETVEELRTRIKDFYTPEVIGLDCETTGLDPHQSELRLIQLSNLDDLSNIKSIVIDRRKVGTDATREYLMPIFSNPKQVKAGHNLKFDLKFIKKHLSLDVETIFDSFLASVLLEAGVRQEKGYHSLEQVTKRFADITLVKDMQTSDWSANELSLQQIEYAIKDVEVLGAVRKSVIESLKELKLIRCAKLEFDCVSPVAYLELCGFYLDLEEWIDLANKEKTRADELAEKINKAIQPVIVQQSLFGEEEVNLNSHEQVKKYFRLLGIPMPDSTREHFLTPLAKEYPLVADLLEYRGYMKSFNSFGANMSEYVNPATGRIHADFRQIGAETTGRFSVSNPNLQQIPHDEPHRNCFKAEEGNLLVSDDFSQQELRILADLSGDKKFLGLFKSGEDFHKATAAQVFRVPIDQVTKEDRNFAKRLNFGLVYGIGAKKFAESVGILETEAQLIMNNYFNTFKQVDRWLARQRYNVLRTKCARTPSGRLARFEFDDTDWKSRSKAQRNAMNCPIQGGGADMTKRALRLLYDKIKGNEDKVKIVNVVHDEINLEVREDLAEEWGYMMQKCMSDAGAEFMKEVEIKADIHISKVWSKG